MNWFAFFLFSGITTIGFILALLNISNASDLVYSVKLIPGYSKRKTRRFLLILDIITYIALIIFFAFAYSDRFGGWL